MSHPAPSQQPPDLSRGRLLAMSLAAGMAVANIYYNQPLLRVMSQSLGDPRLSSVIPTVTQLGYAAGLLFLLPLGDRMERRRLIVVHFLALAVALAVAALAGGLTTLALASILIGAAAAVAQQIVPYAALLAPPAQRGAAIGTVMSGLLSGIVLSRTLAGLVSSVLGWRGMFALAVPVALLGAWLMHRCLPKQRPVQAPSYGALLASLGQLWRTEPLLRRSALTQAMLFGGFSAFWTVLALRLAEPPLQLGSVAAGLFGLVGAVGVTMAPMAGRLADRRGPSAVITLGIVSFVLAWLLLGLWPGLVGMIVGVIVLDFGLQVALIAHQHCIYGLHPQYKSRLNTVFMTLMFLGGALGSALSAVLWAHKGWPGVVCLGGGMGLLGWLSHLRPVPAARSGAAGS